jgi:hypothetical protein
MSERRRRSAHQAVGKPAANATSAENGRLSLVQAARADMAEADRTGSVIHRAGILARMPDFISGHGAVADAFDEAACFRLPNPFPLPSCG